MSILMYLSAVSLSVSISAMEVALVILILLLIRHLWRNSIDITVDCPYFIPFFIYWLATVASLFFGSSYANITDGVFSVWGLLYFFGAYYFISSGNIRFTLGALVAGSVALALSAAADVVLYSAPRGDGFLSIYMSTGNLLALSAALALAVIVSGYEKGLGAFLYGVALVVIVIGIYYTGTRGALLSFIVAACIMFVVRFRAKGIFAAALLVAFAVVAAYFTGIGDRFTELLQGFGDKDTSHGWRLVLWQAAWELIKEYPLFGIGQGAFEPMIIGSMPSNAMAVSHPHNAYIHQITLYGIVGFVAFCLLYGKITFDLAKSMFKNKYAFMGFFVMIVFFLEGITENNFTDGEIKMFQMFVAGAMLGAVKKSISDKAKDNVAIFFKKTSKKI